MLTSFALIFLVGLSAAAICGYLHLPRIIGMLFTGIILGPHVLGLLDDKILSISSELRQIALIIILLKAGLSLNLADLKKVGRPAVMMAFVPASFEICGYLLCAPMILGITRIESAVMGAVLAAVSPAVVVPADGTADGKWIWNGKEYPADDPGRGIVRRYLRDRPVFHICRHGTGRNGRFTQFLNIPVSIVLGILLGAAVGYLLSLFFETAYAKEHYVRNSMKVIVVLGLSFLLMAVETWAKPYVSVSGLLAVVSMACVLKMKCPKSVSGRLSEKFGKLWIAAEVVLFVMVGAAVDIRYTATAGGAAVVMILLALIFRAAGVCVCMAETALNRKERLFTVIAYLPKATVQAAIGSVPMAMGLSCGQIVLSVAVLAILITAPLGAIGMDVTYLRLLKRQE